jgi:hypothetical protein
VLAALVRRGFEIHVSGLALYELAVHFSGGGDEQTGVGADEHVNLRSRMNAIAAVSGGRHVRFAPTHEELVDKLGGHMVGATGSSYSHWLAAAQQTWGAIASGGPLSAEVTQNIELMASYVHTTSRKFMRTVAAAAAIGELGFDVGVEEARRYSSVWDGITESIRLPPPYPARVAFDAYSRLTDFHGAVARARAVRLARAHEENDAIDLGLLQHLAQGLVLVTRDYRLVEDVDACGTSQAPWVRVAGELLRGQVPVGPPFGEWASRAAVSHRPRTRVELRLSDESGAKLARVEGAARHGTDDES